jgi:signal transduction histidine kinase
MEPESAEQVRIVIVEDEAITALDLGQQLRGLGYAVVTAHSAAEAISAVERHRPNLVLMDIRLDAEMDGIAAAHAIRARMDVPVIYVTAYADDATVQRAKRTEPFGYILKPFDERELRTTIELALFRHRMERQRADFVAMLSHDIRNPLGIMLAYTEMLHEEVRKGDRVEAEDLLERLSSTMQSLQLLVSNYLEVSRIENGQLRMYREPLQMNDLVTRVCRQYETAARRRGIHFDISLPDSLPPADADAVATERIITNLICNAVKFAPAAGRVTITAAERDHEVAVSVTDNGGGIPAARLPGLFERYGHPAAPELRGGVGLGLFIAKTLVEAQGGRIEVASTPDRGTRFSIFLPAAAATTSAPAFE